MFKVVKEFNNKLSIDDKKIADLLAQTINENLSFTENKIRHAHPVWFIDGNPIVGYSKLKESVRLMFWSGQSFKTPGLNDEDSFKAAELSYTSVDQIDIDLLKLWLKESEEVQWDYKNIYKTKGKLNRLK